MPVDRKTDTCSSACTVVVLPRSVAKCSGHRPIVFSWSTNRVRPYARARTFHYQLRTPPG